VFSVLKSDTQRKSESTAPKRRATLVGICGVACHDECADALNSFIEFDFARHSPYLAFSAVLREAVTKEGGEEKSHVPEMRPPRLLV
jgi:hypothetical protein